MTQTFISPRKNGYTMYNKNSIMPRTIGGIIEDIFQKGFNTAFGNDAPLNDSSAHAPVNIQEADNSYELQLVAPGLKKDEFKVGVDRNILTISYEYKEEANSETPNKWIRNEYKMRSFKRSFTLNEKVDTGNISAKYTDGVLYVNLPKKDIAEQKTQEISVG